MKIAIPLQYSAMDTVDDNGDLITVEDRIDKKRTQQVIKILWMLAK